MIELSGAKSVKPSSQKIPCHSKHRQHGGFLLRLQRSPLLLLLFVTPPPLLLLLLVTARQRRPVSAPVLRFGVPDQCAPLCNTVLMSR